MSIPKLDFQSFRPPADAKRNGSEYHFPCPVSGAGIDRAWCDPDKGTFGCREHGGKLTGRDFTDHARALGILPVDLGRRSDAPLETWAWTTATGRKRKQFRWRCRCGGNAECDTCHGKGTSKRWAKKRDARTPAPDALLYVPHPLDGASTIYLCEGGSSADALTRHGLIAVGFNNADPTRDSLDRLPADPRIVIWPDHDASGYRQAIRFADALRSTGRTVDAVDPVRLNPDAPPAWDPGDWRPPAGVTPADAILPAIGPLDAIRDRAPAPAPAPGADAAILEIPQPDTGAGVDAALRHCGFAHRKNLRADRGEVRALPAGDWESRTDEWCATARRLIRERCVTLVMKDGESKEVPVAYTAAAFQDVLLAHAYDHAADPFREWLESLPAWDGQPRRWLAHCFPSLTANPLAEWASRSVTLACVRLCYHPGSRVQEAVVLVGERGVGKSTALAWLFPPTRREDWFTDAVNLAAPMKELVEAFAGRVLVEFGDMAGAHRADVGRLKSLLTTTSFGSVRLAYRRDPVPHPRRVVFSGTANPPDVLPLDPSGAISRRFVVLPVTETAIDHAPHVTAYLDAHREQLWAEALHRFTAGEPHHLPDDLKRQQAASNAPYETTDEAAVAMVTAVLGSPLPNRVQVLDVRDGIARRCEAAGLRTSPISDGRIVLALKLLGYESQRSMADRWWELAPMTPHDTISCTLGIDSTFSTNRVNVEKVGTSRTPKENGVMGCHGPVPAPDAMPAERPDPTREELREHAAAAGAPAAAPPKNEGAPPLGRRPEFRRHPPPLDPTREELREHAAAAGADLVLDTAGRPVWWRESDGHIEVAVAFPAPAPGDPDPSGDACSRCGRPWSASTGPGYCSRCDAGAAWDGDDYERRLRRLPIDDLQGLNVALATQDGRERELTIVRDELQRRKIH